MKILICDPSAGTLSEVLRALPGWELHSEDIMVQYQSETVMALRAPAPYLAPPAAVPGYLAPPPALQTPETAMPDDPGCPVP